MSATSHEVTEPALHHSWLERKVNDHLFLTIIDSSKQRLV